MSGWGGCGAGCGVMGTGCCHSQSELWAWPVLLHGAAQRSAFRADGLQNECPTSDHGSGRSLPIFKHPELLMWRAVLH